MNPLPKPELPKPLPRRLSDPLRVYRWLLLLLVLPAIVVSLLLPDVRKVREAASRVAAKNNLRQLRLATEQYADAFGGMPSNPDSKPNPDGDPIGKVQMALLPYLEPEQFRGSSEPSSPERVPGLMPFLVPAERPAPVPAPIPESPPQGESNPSQSQSRIMTLWQVLLASSFPLLLCTVFVLPRRITNALYLRSFRNDAQTGTLRSAAQAALGRSFRLSGIRDPRRRWPALIRHLFYLLFLIRYAQPKFMNLEAGNDWKVRLWRSLGDARCALIDITELTPFVCEEINLAIRCLGFQRVLFLGDRSRTVDEWRHLGWNAVTAPDGSAEQVQVAVWSDTDVGQAAFREQVRRFVDRLPAEPPELSAASIPDVRATNDPESNPVTGESWNAFLCANVIGAGTLAGLGWAQLQFPAASLLWCLPLVVYNMLALILLLQYLAECGFWRERLRIAAVFVVGSIVAGWLASGNSPSVAEAPEQVSLERRL